MPSWFQLCTTILHHVGNVCVQFVENVSISSKYFVFSLAFSLGMMLARNFIYLIKLVYHLSNNHKSIRSRKSRIRPWGSVAPPRETLYRQKLALTSPTSGGLSVGIVRSRTKATEFLFHKTIIPDITTNGALFRTYILLLRLLSHKRLI
jgi:hypothetical protein